MTFFANRTEAGRLLAEALRSYAKRDDVIILALPRGGVPLGLTLAHALKAPLDLLLVRKLGVPGHRELAIGAITRNTRELNQEVVSGLGISEAVLAEVERRERAELERRSKRYRGDKPAPRLKGRCVILVDDGIATGATMAAAARAVRKQQPLELVLAVPVAPLSSLARFTPLVDKIECLESPVSFWAISAYYRDFPQVSDTQVVEMMAEAALVGGDP